ncbi:MAG: DUF1893 domain-containing protein [Kiritimatiellia bacterium]
MVEVKRRAFLAGLGTTVLASAAEEKTVDGGYADVFPPGVPDRKVPVAPPGAGSLSRFRLACVGCQLCVQTCPSHVLRPSLRAEQYLQPEMGFEKGYCRPECTTCGEVCPTGAIRRIAVADKKNVHVGRVVWHATRCLAATSGVSCTSCERHCPVKAIVLVPTVENDRSAPKVPVVDTVRCIGCGACEHLCPARPLPALTVEGWETHREVKPMGETDVLAEARALFGKGQSAVVVVKEGVIVASGTGMGVAPLLDLQDRRPDDLKGAWVIDKVVGRAAAAIAVAGGAARVHGMLMSDEAAAFLKEKGVPCSSDARVPRILDRTRSGLCPLEASVEGLSDPKEMLKAIRRKIESFKKKAQLKTAGQSKDNQEK